MLNRDGHTGLLSRLASGFDRLIETVAPVYGARRMEARMNMAMASEFFSGGGFDAADRTSREMGNWTPFPTDADSAMLGLEDMRSRSRDAVRNQPLAGGIVNTTVMNVVGVGLTMHSRIDRDVLNLSDAEADAWQKNTERRWKLWAGSKDCDIERTLTFNGHTQLALRCRVVNGESLTLLPYLELAGLSNPLRLQAVESDRLCNPQCTLDRKNLVNGVEKDSYGAPKVYHIMDSHPGNLLYADPRRSTWSEYPAFNPNTGLRNVIHYYRVDRPGQTRGYPELAPILEPLKDLSRMSKAELKRAVVSALFTVFIKSNGQPMGNSPAAPMVQQYPGMTVTTGAGDQSAATTGNIKLGYGAVVGLGNNQEIQLADPKLPNQNFDPFFLANVRQIGMQIGIPYEVLIKHYTASYSAARAAIEDAWAYFMFMRADLIDNYCNIVFAVWMAQEVAQGTIYAPGFFSDPMVRAAWLGNEWTGPSKPILDPVKEADAAKARSDLAISTLSQETSSMNGGDWEKNVVQRGKEQKMLEAAGLGEPKQPAPKQPEPPHNPDLPEAA